MKANHCSTTFSTLCCRTNIHMYLNLTNRLMSLACYGAKPTDRHRKGSVGNPAFDLIYIKVFINSPIEYLDLSFKFFAYSVKPPILKCIDLTHCFKQKTSRAIICSDWSEIHKTRTSPSTFFSRKRFNYTSITQ